MTGCRFGAKNTLDQNYLYLAEKRGARGPRRDRGRPRSARGPDGRLRASRRRPARRRRARRLHRENVVVFAGGVWARSRCCSGCTRTRRAAAPLADARRLRPHQLRGAHRGRHARQRRSICPRGSPSARSSRPTSTPTSSPSATAPGSGFFRLLAAPHVSGARCRCAWRTARRGRASRRHPLRVRRAR